MGGFFVMKLTIIDPVLPSGMVDKDMMEYLDLKCRFKSCPIFRLYSVLMYGQPLNSLAPLPYVMKLLIEPQNGDGCSREFDIAYAHQLLNHSPSFVDLMTLLSPIQMVDEVFLLSDYQNAMVSSLVKFIYERYGINVFMVKDMMDIDELQVSNFASEECYSNLINDIDRYKMTYFTKEQIENDFIE